MVVAAGIMISGAFLSIALSFFRLDYFLLIGASLWLAGGLFAIFAVRKVRPNFLVVTIVIVSISLASLIGATCLVIVQYVKIVHDEHNQDASVQGLLIGTIVGALLSLVLDIWLLIVSAKSFRFLRAKRAFLIANGLNGV